MKPKFRLIGELQSSAVESFWEGFIVRRALTILEGDPGCGKSTILCDLVGRAATGKPMPGADIPGDIGGAVLVTAEDDVQATLLPNLRAAGCDDSVPVMVLDGSSISLPEDSPALESAIQRVNASIVVIDPITAFLSNTVNNDQVVRRSFKPLIELARKYDLALIAVRHLAKASRKASYAGAGSIALTGLARTVLLAGNNPNDSGSFVLTTAKSSLGLPQSIEYSLHRDTETGGLSVLYRGASAATADDLLAVESGERRSALQEAEDFLFGLLEDGPKLCNDVVVMASRQGIAKSTLKRAKYVLQICSVKRGIGLNQHWWWCLPRDEASLRRVKQRHLDRLAEELTHGSLLAPDEDDDCSPPIGGGRREKGGDDSGDDEREGQSLDD